MAKRHYILLITDEPKLIGPFGSLSDLSSWGRAWQAAHKDDPRWQHVDLDVSEDETIAGTYRLPIVTTSRADPTA